MGPGGALRRGATAGGIGATPLHARGDRGLHSSVRVVRASADAGADRERGDGPRVALALHRLGLPRVPGRRVPLGRPPRKRGRGVSARHCAAPRVPPRRRPPRAASAGSGPLSGARLGTCGRRMAGGRNDLHEHVRRRARGDSPTPPPRGSSSRPPSRGWWSSSSCPSRSPSPGVTPANTSRVEPAGSWWVSGGSFRALTILARPVQVRSQERVTRPDPRPRRRLGEHVPS